MRENEFLEKLTVLKKLHANWQSSQETIDSDEDLSNANTIPINASKELIKFAHEIDTKPSSSKMATDDLLTLTDNQNGNNDDRGYVSTDNVDTKYILSETATDELSALTESQDNINDDKESVSTENEDIIGCLSSDISSQENPENITIFDIMKNVNIDKIKSRRGRPKGSTKPFWSFSSRTKPSGKKRKRNSENETKPNMNKIAKTGIHSDISLSSSPQSKQDTPWIETTRFTLTKTDKDEIEGKCQLSDKIIEAAQSILKQQFPNLNGELSALTESQDNINDDNINDDKESVSTENEDIIGCLSSDISSQENPENITIFDIMKNVNIDKIKSRRGRPKGSTKPFWSFSSRTKPSGKKRKRNSENETKPNMNKIAKTGIHSDISLSSSPQSKQDTPWIETTRFTLTKTDKDEIEGKCQLSDKIIEAAQSILKQQFPNLNGFQSTLFKQNIKHLKKEDKNMIQILHRGTINSGHWFTISTVDCGDGQVNWFDSLFNDLDVDTKRQICAIMKTEASQLNFLKCPVQNQIGGADCGLFAIAFAVAMF